MRLNELHKFSDGTLTRVMEKLDHMVKDFHLFKYNKGMETRKWSEDDKRRSKDFITAIEKRLQIRRIYQSLESFVAVSSSLRLLEPKRTIESRAKRSSINLVRTQHPSETRVFHNEDGNPARANVKQALGSYERPHKGVKASANSDIMYFFTSAQDGDPLQDDPTITEEDGTIRTKKYEELSATEKIQADCDCKATNIVLQGLSPDVYAIVNHHKVVKEIWDRVKLLMQGTKLSLQEKECKLYDEFDKFTFVKGETLYQYYWRFAQLINNMNAINMSMRAVQVNTKFLNSLPPEWKSLVWINALQIWNMMYCFVNNIHVDYAKLLWEGLYYSLHHPTSSIPYPRFTKIIVSHYMTIFPEISRRARDKYHNLKDDDIMKNIFYSGRHKDKVGMQIPAWMISEEMKQTEHYRMYAEVFGIDVPLTQLQPTKSTQGTHRTPSAPRSPNPNKKAAESSAPRRSTMIRFCIPERRSARLTPPAPVPNVDKADEMILQDTLQDCAHDTKESPEVEITKDKEVEITKDKEVEITKETPVVDITNVVIPVNVNDEDEEITDEVYELKRREKWKIVEETRNSQSHTNENLHRDSYNLNLRIPRNLWKLTA
ncbi:retrovirus-related pol polyprotein from transposon TNT 1-94 [Tanacetum coccineum]